jgi:hypothetical protein
MSESVFQAPLVNDVDAQPAQERYIPPPTTKLLNDRYELGDELGGGVSSKVFMAMDHKTSTNVAIKCYDSWNGCESHFRCAMQW